MIFPQEGKASIVIVVPALRSNWPKIEELKIVYLVCSLSQLLFYRALPLITRQMFIHRQSRGF